MNLIAELDEISATDGDRVGGKAVALAALHHAGCSVPRTLCLTSEAYELFVAQASLRAMIQQELGRKNFADMRWEELWDTALRIRNHFLRAPIPDQVVSALQQRLAGPFSDRRLAVRSSAPGEDSQAASFAGLHESIVNVRGLAATLEATRKVWASLWSDRALLYRHERGLDVDASAMAVVIQELVEGTCSGVAFGVHPGDPALVAVEAVYGLNQGLVDGTIEPDRWSLARETARLITHAAPSERRRLVADGSQTRLESLPPEQARLPPLNEQQLQRVFEAVRAAEELFGSPQDLEWTFEAGRLVLLQSRPITTATVGQGDKRAWYLSLTRSLQNLRQLRERVENELLPALEQEAKELLSADLEALEDAALARAIERRLAAHDRWVDVYTRDFIPMAHGIRLFGQFYNEMVGPEDPYEFMGLLVSTPLLSTRRNRALAELASRVRHDPELRARLEAGDPGQAAFEEELELFEHEFGAAAFAAQKCFGDRARLIRFLLALAALPALPESSSQVDSEKLGAAFLAAVDDERRPLAAELLELGRASYRLRDDDNLYLARLEVLVLDAVREGRRRLGEAQTGQPRSDELARILDSIRHPNLVAEPRPSERPLMTERGFRASPRQLVGQPAGPGIASGTARVIESTDDLFRFQAGEVLVCDAIDPNMTFVVPLAAAVVERRGGMLIHGAIITREYGLACVTGVPQVTSLISTGDRLTVDGYLGLVTVLRD